MTYDFCIYFYSQFYLSIIFDTGGLKLLFFIGDCAQGNYFIFYIYIKIPYHLFLYHYHQ